VSSEQRVTDEQHQQQQHSQHHPVDPRDRERELREPEVRKPANHERIPPDGPPSYPDGETSHKRKRSLSDSPRRERIPSPPTRTERLDGPDRDRQDRPDRPEQQQQQPPQRPRIDTGDGGAASQPPREVSREDARDNAENWQPLQQPAKEERTSSYEAPYSANPMSGQSEEPMSDAMRRAASHGEDEQSPDGDDRSPYPGPYTPVEPRKDGVVQADPKKRKRNFSNRTKTGCLTCRKRKKKCDEQKPECELFPSVPAFSMRVWPIFAARRVDCVYMPTLCGRF
jgi:hypothetical protein